MRVLFFSKNLLAGDMALRLQQEGNEVRLFIDDKNSRECFSGMIPKVQAWKKELNWVGKDGLIIFDDHGYGDIQDSLRKKGFAVVGGSAEADRLELDRAYGQSVFSKYGLRTALLRDFENSTAAIDFIKRQKGPWVLKQNGSIAKNDHYIGEAVDGSDIVLILEKYRNSWRTKGKKITLHRRIRGIEIGVARFFNGEDWVGPIEFNIEHPRLFPGNLGPVTNEMGTLAWYSDDESNKLYSETLAKLKQYLQETQFKGDMALNCIVNETGAYILEATPRFGSPIVHLQRTLQSSEWGTFLNALARGEKFELSWRKGYGVVVLMALPPFPYADLLPEYSSYGIDFSLSDFSKEELSRIHFEEVARRPDQGKDQYYVARKYGFLMYVTGVGVTVEAAQKEAYSLAQKIKVPKIFYRNDIGTSFREKDREQLRSWGYLS